MDLSAQTTMDRTEFLRAVFPGLTDSWVLYISSSLHTRHYPTGAVVCREGEVGRTFFIIESGTVEVSKQLDDDAARILARQGPGEFFGELALVQDIPRAATVTALEDTVLLEISKDDFNQYLNHNPAMAAAIMRAVAARLRDADQRAMADLRRKNVELAQAYEDLQREVARRGEFLTVVSHELRTPLTSVKGYIHLLKAGMLKGADLDRAVETLTRNFDMIVRLVNNILFLQEIELVVPQMELLNLEAIVRGIVEQQASKARDAGLRILTEIEGRLPRLRGDEDSLTQAISALLDNAIKFSPNGGDILVKIRRDGPHAVISVRDPGVGIEPELIDHIFDRLHLLDKKGDQLFGGLGIGLPLVRAVVQHHDGAIHVKSEPGNGSTFTIQLPFR
ncbi:MAG TPA: ATP-binding protein [Anaerolineae bacterium]|nr:ATP-binding protein [Anaerolineae bacterium]